MSAVAVALTSVLGAGGLGGLAVLYRARADRGAVVVDTVSKGVLVLERLNDRLEGDLVAVIAERDQERDARRAVERERDQLERERDQLARERDQLHQHAAGALPTPEDTTEDR